jgi:hypothetical protein
MLCDSEREREVLATVRQRTYSVWEYMDSRPECINNDYVESPGALLMPLPTLLRNVQLWKERHCFFSPKQTMMFPSSSETEKKEASSVTAVATKT